MLIKLASALFAVLAACAGCATTNPVVTKVGHGVDCTGKDIVQQLPAIFSEVGTDLLAPSPEASTDLLTRLEMSLVKSVGQRLATDMLVCAVEVSGESADSHMAMTHGDQPNQRRIKANAAAYLRLRDVHFAQPPARTSAASLPICRPACDSCHFCFQIYSAPPSPPIPPTCAPKQPKPLGCP